MASASLSARLAPRALLPLSARIARPAFAAAQHRLFHQSPNMASQHKITTLDVRVRILPDRANFLTCTDLLDSSSSRVFPNAV